MCTSETSVLAGFWFTWVQLWISLTLTSQRWGTPELMSPWGPFSVNGVGWIYGINAGMTVVLQYPLLRLAERWLRPLQIVVLGTGCTALGLGLVATASSLPMLLGCVAVFSIGVMLVMPTQQTVTAQFAEPQALGAYFGFAALALAFGGASGNLLGGWLYDAAIRWQLPALPWLAFGAVGGSVALGLALLERHLRRAPGGSVTLQPSSTS